MLDASATIFRPLFSSGLLTLLTCLAITAALFCYMQRSHLRLRKRTLLLALRLIAVGLLLWLLLGPSVQIDRSTSTRKLSVHMLIDTSLSMNEPDIELDAKAITRYELLRRHWLGSDFTTALGEQALVRWFRFDESLTPVTLDRFTQDLPAGRATDLYAALGQSMQTSHAPDLIVLLSDGHDTSSRIETLTRSLKKQRTRVIAVPVGNAQLQRDIAVAAWSDADQLYPGQRTQLHASISASGLVDEPLTIDLLHEGSVLASQRIASAAAHQRVQFEITAEDQPSHTAIYEIRVHPVPGERDDANNSQRVFVQILREKMKVLLVENEPYWDTRFLARTLSEHPQVDLTTLFGLGDRLLQVGGDTTVPNPLTARWISQFDAIILGRGCERFFPGSSASLLVDFVQQGGSLILARDRPFNTRTAEGREAAQLLAVIEPVEWGRALLEPWPLQLTPEGRRLGLLEVEQLGPPDAVLEQLPEMLAVAQIRQQKAAAMVLLSQAVPQHEAASVAALAYQQAGQGRVLAVLTSGLWRWAFLPTRDASFNSIYQLFWMRTLHWMVSGSDFLPGQQISLTLSRTSVEPGDRITATVNTRYIDPSLTHLELHAINPEGQLQLLELQPSDPSGTQWQAQFSLKEIGLHRVQLTTGLESPARIEQPLAILQRSIELQDASAWPHVLAKIAADTGGECIAADQPQQLLDLVHDLTTAQQGDPIVRYDFAQPWVLALLLATLGLEWLIRRHGGLL